MRSCYQPGFSGDSSAAGSFATCQQCCCGQDGRSATLTAPNRFSQQEASPSEYRWLSDDASGGSQASCLAYQTYPSMSKTAQLSMCTMFASCRASRTFPGPLHDRELQHPIPANTPKQCRARPRGAKIPSAFRRSYGWATATGFVRMLCLAAVLLLSASLSLHAAHIAM